MKVTRYSKYQETIAWFFIIYTKMNIFDSALKFSLWNENSASYLNVHGVPWVTNWNWFLEVCIWKINWNSDVENSVNKLWNRWPLNSEIIATAKGPSFFFFCAMAHNGEVWSTLFNPLTTGRRGGLNKSRPVSRCLSICLPLTHIFIWISS